MIRALKHLRDFIDDETKKWMPGKLQARTCILLVQNKGGDDGTPFHCVVQVFDQSGTWIGEIAEPDFIPGSR